MDVFSGFPFRQLRVTAVHHRTVPLILQYSTVNTHSTEILDFSIANKAIFQSVRYSTLPQLSDSFRWIVNRRRQFFSLNIYDHAGSVKRMFCTVTKRVPTYSKPARQYSANEIEPKMNAKTVNALRPSTV